ncbi:SAV_915 family protein [Streptomyces sp. NPDC002589]|uniref:SAV_915 family protein n=1 Tax=Streptomyces sp. NPDC002589 TaxID=3154420 RepID=UPI00332D0886
MDSVNRSQEVPDVLVLPTMADLPRGEDGAPILDGTVDVMLIPMEVEPGQERHVALAFSTVVRLVEALGEEQPWVAIPTDQLESALTGSGAQAILMDPQLAGGAEASKNG